MALPFRKKGERPAFWEERRHTADAKGHERSRCTREGGDSSTSRHEAIHRLPGLLKRAAAVVLREAADKQRNGRRKGALMLAAGPHNIIHKCGPRVDSVNRGDEVFILLIKKVIVVLVVVIVSVFFVADAVIVSPALPAAAAAAFA